MHTMQVRHWLIPLLATTAGALAAQHEVLDQACGVAVTLPTADWKLTDQSSGGAIVHIYSPATPPVPRVTLLRIPAAFLPAGLATRRKQMEQIPALHCEPLRPSELAGQQADLLDYSGGGVRHIERAVRSGDAWVIVQVAARAADWSEPQRAAAFARVWESARLVEVQSPAAKLAVDPKTPDQVRAIRDGVQPQAQAFAVVAHDLLVEIEPSAGSLRVRDDLTIAAGEKPLQHVDLICTLVEVDGVTAGGRDLTWEKRGDGTLRIQLGEPLRPGQQRKLRFVAHAGDYRQAMDQKLVAEIAVFGQVAPDSSFSSHVVYYPVDHSNDASVRIELSVPEELVAVSGGTLLGVESAAGRRSFRYEEPIRTPRLLPFGFAVARYEVLRGTTPSGLVLELFHPADKKAEAERRLQIATTCGELFEDWMGPLPWRRVGFCWVKPTAKETGVSLPGQVLVSDGFFRSSEGVELTGSGLNDPQALGLLLIADELSHQWNAYAVPLPNELAEGISTFTNCLFLEHVRGAGEYRDGIDFCAQAYLATAAGTTDYAVADPALYRSDIYRAVAFCKVPAVLDLLRQRLGDERFRRAWRHAFTTLRGDRGGYDAFARALGESAEVDLQPFFAQWFFQAGHPRPVVRWSCNEERGRHVLTLEVEQGQPGGLFEFQLLPQADCGDAEPAMLEPLQVTQRKQAFQRPLPAAARGIAVRPEGNSRLIPVRVEALGR